MKTEKLSNKLVLKTFLSLFPVQAISVGLPSVNVLITGALIGAFLGEKALAAQGFALPVVIAVRIMLIFNVGAQILCGQLLGRGDEEEIKKTFSTSITFSMIAGILMTLVVVFFSKPLAVILGAGEDMVPITAEYLRGYGFSVIPTMLTTCLLSALQLDCEKVRPVMVIIVNMVLNIAANLFNIFVLKRGVFGVGLANTFAYIVSVLMCLPHFLRKTRIFRFSFSGVRLGILKEITRLGAPTAILALCDSVRGGILNNVVHYFYGSVGIAAMAVAGNISQSIADPIQAGDIGATGIVASILCGERDVESLRELPKTVIKAMAPITLTAYALVFFLAGPISAAFGAPAENMGIYIFFIRFISTWIVVDMFVSPSIAINQSLGKTGMSMLLNILNILLFQVVVFGVALWFNIPWLSICSGTISCIMVYGFIAIYYTIKQKKLPKSIFEVTYIPSDFSVPAADRLALTVRNIQESMEASVDTIGFCLSKAFSKTASNMAGLCVEEITSFRLLHSKTGNSRKEYSIDIRIIYEKNGIDIMIRDNYPGFNPAKWLENFHSDDPFKALGIRTVMKAAKKVDCASVLNLNILTIRVDAS